ncbi:MAG: phospho-2-dehydro-3-deoxyheptonate aldolase [Myxococcales bacterium]|nr:phospho-2-dehydro-3-deoxyheptonate aldolase [Myxococcales bacterium]
MLILMHATASPLEVDAVAAKVRSLGFEPHKMPGAQRIAVAITGNPGPVDPAHFQHMGGVAEAVSISKPFKLASRETHPHDTVISIQTATAAGPSRIGGGIFGIIAGPCAVEGREQTLTAARAVKAAGATFLRGGAFKPRTSPYSFQGTKLDGLKILAEARHETGLPIITEVVDSSHVEQVAEYADVLQIGTRNAQNFALLEAVSQVRKPVLLKRGMSSTIQEFLMAAEYVVKGGNYQVILCERGIRTFEPMTRNTLDLGSIPLIKRLTHLPIVVDPSHATGDSLLVRPMARAALAAGADGIMVDVHPDPDKALCDGPQSLRPEEFAELMTTLRAMAEVLKVSM